MQNNEQKGSLTDKFRDFGAAPSEGLWDSISGQLDEKKKRRIAGFWWWSSGFAACLIAVVWLYMVSDSSENITITSTDKNTTADQQSVSSQTTDSSDNAAASTTSITHNNSQNTASTSKEQLQTTNRFNPGKQASKTIVQEEQAAVQHPAIPKEKETLPVEPAPAPQDSLMAEEPNVLSDSITQDDSSNDPATAFVPQKPLLPPSALAPRWMIGFRTADWQAFDQSTAFNQKPPGINSTTGTQPLVPETDSDPNTVSLRHHASFEIFASYRFYNRFWLETALHGGYWSSGKITGSGFQSTSSSSWSVGIPLYLHADIISKPRFQLYGGIGMNHDFPFFKQVVYVPENADYLSVSETTPGLRYVSSLQYHLGARYQVYRGMHVEVRPAVRNYLITGSNNGVHLSGKWWWGVSAGLSWKLN